MGESGEKNGVVGIPLDHPLTWRCPEGHTFRFRRRPLLSSCIFIFCFLIAERAAVYAFKTFLPYTVSKTLGVDNMDTAPNYMWISLFFGVYDLSPILLALVSDTFLGCFKALVVFGFTFVFGLALSVLAYKPSLLSGSVDPTASKWITIIALFLVAISSGGLMQLLVTFGAGQFHPTSQTASGSRFLSQVYGLAGIGAVIGIIASTGIWYTFLEFYKVLFCIVLMAFMGWVCFLAGSWSYVDRCVHPRKTFKFLALAWECLKKRSFEKNMISYGGAHSDRTVMDLRLVVRLVPVFACLTPLYSGQLQILTTVRDLISRLPTEKLRDQTVLSPELFMIAEPLTMVLMATLLNGWLYPWLKRKWGLVITHLMRFVVAAGFMALGFVFCFLIDWLFAGTFRNQSTAAVFVTLVPIFMFATGQLLVMSSGLELSWSHAPEVLRSVSVALFSSIYAVGSLLSLGLFGIISATSPEKERNLGGNFNAFKIHAFKPQDQRSMTGEHIYFIVNGSLCVVSLLCLLGLRGFYERTRQMKIERDIEQRAIEIALSRIQSL
jgi:hypothetical protein